MQESDTVYSPKRTVSTNLQGGGVGEGELKAVLTIWIQDLVCVTFLTHEIRDPGMGKKSRSGSGIRIRDENPGSYLRELRNNILG
jgi:hypothetical protein